MRLLRVTVKPKARTSSLRQADDGTWVATVTAPPVEGRANEELIRLVAAHFGVPRSRVTIRSGLRSRVKTVVIAEES